MFRTGIANPNGGEAVFYESTAPTPRQHETAMNQVMGGLSARTLGLRANMGAPNQTGIEIARARPRITPAMEDALKTEATPLKDLKTVGEIADIMKAIYANKESLIVNNHFQGTTLENRIVAKAYALSLIKFVETMAHEFAEQQFEEGHSFYGKIEGYVVGRTNDTNRLDSTTTGSRVQAILLTLNGTPFYAVDAGNNGELSVVVRNKIYNLGYYRAGTADRDHMPTIRYGVENNTCETFITTKEVLPNQQEVHTNNGPVLQVRKKSNRFRQKETECAQFIFQQLLDSSIDNEGDLLFQSVIKNTNEFRELCELPHLLPEENNDLITKLSEMHNLTKSSISASTE